MQHISYTAMIIQARVSSTRLPEKILMPFYDKYCCLELLVERIKPAIDIPIIIATSSNKKDNAIESLSKKMNVLCYRGDEHNVLKRFIDCAKQFNLKNIIRVCSDNPFLNAADLDWTTLLLEKYLSESDAEIAKIQVTHGKERLGDIPCSLASIVKQKHYWAISHTYFRDRLKRSGELVLEES